ncbi:MAG TPA: hypothetical protein VG675_12210 [Bryobacteraceae bacterium]|nr:hypothetical protein [Bryobacteraceae bacterium]
MQRLFAADGRCFDLAMDHGVFHNPEFLAGIEDLPASVALAVEGGPDAIQLGIGQAHLLQEIPGKSKPSLVLRIDVANVYGKDLPEQLFCHTLGHAIEQALRVDAAAVVLNLFDAPGRTELYRQCVANIAAVKPECEGFGMPLMIEPLALKDGRHGNYESAGDVERIVPLVRQAAELGADLIKCDPPDEAADFERVVEAASGRPVLARGGGRLPEEEIFRRTRELMEAGASGIVYGRNVIQNPRPKAMIEAFLAIVHGSAEWEEALALYHGASGLRA